MGSSSTSRPVAVAADSTTDDLELIFEDEDEELLTIAEQLGLNIQEQEEEEERGDEEIVTVIYQILNQMFAADIVQIERFLINSIRFLMNHV